MPHRPHSHLVRDLASLAVEGIFAASGWATEPVVKDYGEDLLVQPCADGKMEDFKLWVQVKGVLDGREDDAWRVDVEHAMRWVRSREYVVFVVVSLVSGTAQFCLPRHQLRDAELRRGGASSVVLRPDGPLDPDHVKKLYWVALLDHYEHQLRARKMDLQWHPFSSGISLGAKVAEAQSVAFMAAELVVRLKVVVGGEPMKLDETFKTLRRSVDPVEYRLDELEQQGVSNDLSQSMIALLLWVQERTGVVPPMEVVHTCALLMKILEAPTGASDRL